MKYLLARRFTQISILVLYVAANIWGLKILEGNLSFSYLFETIPLSDPYATVQMFAAGSIMTVDLVIGTVIVAVFYAIVGGRFFCSWVCPINMVTDLANYLRRKLDIARYQKRLYMSRTLRFWVLGLSLVLSFVMGLTAFELISPIAILHRGIVFGIGFGFTAILVIFLLDLLVHENAWCGHICPLGAFYTLLGKFSLVRVKYNLDACTSCMQCKVVCPEKEVLDIITHVSATITQGECTNCARCIEVCEDDALNFGIRRFIKDGKNEA